MIIMDGWQDCDLEVYTGIQTRRDGLQNKKLNLPSETNCKYFDQNKDASKTTLQQSNLVALPTHPSASFLSFLLYNHNNLMSEINLLFLNMITYFSFKQK